MVLIAMRLLVTVLCFVKIKHCKLNVNSNITQYPMSTDLDKMFIGPHNSITFTVLESNKRSLLDDFANHILQMFHQKANKTVEIKKYLERTKLPHNFINAILAWDEEDLARTITNSMHFYLDSQQFYVLILHSVLNLKKLESLFAFCWHNYQALNLFVWYDDTLFLYDPFMQIYGGYKGGLKIMTSVMQHWLKDLNGFPLKISMFPRYPTAMTELPNRLSSCKIYKKLMKKSGGFSGLDGFLLGSIAEKMNFTVKIINVTSGHGFGYMRNGMLTGSLKDVVEGSVHFSANGRFVTSYGNFDIDYSQPYASDDICAVTSRTRAISPFVKILKQFGPIVWIAHLLVLFSCCFIIYILNHKREFSKIVTHVFSYLVGRPVIRPLSKFRFIIMACLFLNIIIVGGILQSSFMNAFSTVTYFSEIKTIDELNELGIGVFSSLNNLVNNRKLKLIDKNSHDGDGDEQLIRLITQTGQYAMLERRKDFLLYLETTCLIENGRWILNIVDETIASYLTAFIFPRGSPFKVYVDRLIKHLYEAGFTIKWYNDFEYALTLGCFMKLTDQKIAKPFTLNDINSGVKSDVNYAF